MKSGAYGHQPGFLSVSVRPRFSIDHAGRSHGVIDGDFEDAVQTGVFTNEIGKADRIEGLEKGLKCPRKRGIQSTAGRQRAGVGAAVEAFGKRHLAFEYTENLPHRNFFRRQSQSESARPPAQRLDEAQPAEFVDHDTNVAFGGVQRGNQFMLAQNTSGIDGTGHQHTQGQIGLCRDAHDDTLPQIPLMVVAGQPLSCGDHHVSR